jgi:hypothetical protein
MVSKQSGPLPGLGSPKAPASDPLLGSDAPLGATAPKDKPGDSDRGSQYASEHYNSSWPIAVLPAA